MHTRHLSSLLVAFLAGATAILASGSLLAAEPDAAGSVSASEEKPWQHLFDGRSLGKWQVVDRFEFARHGKVHVDSGHLVLEAGKPATGIRWTGDLPRVNYELALEAMRVEGSDFFCGLTFPVAEGRCTLILGGWGGNVVGLSNINGAAAAENETTSGVEFQNGQWYKIRLRVTNQRIHMTLDDKVLIDLPTSNRKFSVWWEQEPVLPLGIATWSTKGALRDIRLRALPNR